MDQQGWTGCALAAGVVYQPDHHAATWCALHTPKRNAYPLPRFCDRSIKIKPLNRLHILPPWQRLQPAPPPPPSRQDATAAPGLVPAPTPALPTTALVPAVSALLAEASPAPAPAPALAGAGTPATAILRVGALRVLSLGAPQPTKPAFHDRHTILPLGYVARRRFHSVLEALGRVDYLCEIREGTGPNGPTGLPAFSITLERDPSVVFRGRTAAEAYAALLNRRYRLLHTRAPPTPPPKLALEAALFFGVGSPAIAQLIEQLPGTKGCEGFTPRYSMPEAKQRDPPLPRSASGCARTEPIVRRSSAYKYSHQMYYRPFINRGALPYKRDDGAHHLAAAEDAPAPAAALLDERHTSLNLRRRDQLNLSDPSKNNAHHLAQQVSHLQQLKMPCPVRVGRSPIHNWGLFTTRAVPKDHIVVEYMGQALRNSIADNKERVYEAGAFKGQGGDCYMFRLDEACVLDATMRGNIARYINLSCTPNCYSKVVLEPEGEPYVPGSVRGHIVIFAGRDLDENEEVTYDYKFGVEKVKITCHCGSPRCLGVMN